MLRINSEPGFFTEIFTELKACGMAPVSSVSSHSLATANMLNQINNNNQQHHHSHHYLVQSPTGIQSPTGPLQMSMSMSQSMTSTTSSHNMGSLIAAANKMNLNNNYVQESSGGSDSSSSTSSLHHSHHLQQQHSNKLPAGVLA